MLCPPNQTRHDNLDRVRGALGAQEQSRIRCCLRPSLLTDRSLVTLIRVTEDFEARAITFFFAYGDKTWGSGIGWSETEETSAARFYGEGYDGSLLERAKWLVRRFPALYQGCLPQSK